MTEPKTMQTPKASHPSILYEGLEFSAAHIML